MELVDWLLSIIVLCSLVICIGTLLALIYEFSVRSKQ